MWVWHHTSRHWQSLLVESDWSCDVFYPIEARNIAVNSLNQALMTPNCLVANLFFPIEGRRHDAYLFSKSCLSPQLERFSFNANRENMVLFADPADPLRAHLIA